MRTHKPNILTFMAVALVSSLVTLLLIFGPSSTAARQQQLTGNENHLITLDQAVKYVENFKSFPTTPLIKGAYFGKNIFDKILGQAGCVGIRYYYAKKDDGTATIVLVGVDSNGNDLTQGILAEEGLPCPPFCPSPNPLNR
jgi:hypothetical protein